MRSPSGHSPFGINNVRLPNAAQPDHRVTAATKSLRSHEAKSGGNQDPFENSGTQL